MARFLSSIVSLEAKSALPVSPFCYGEIPFRQSELIYSAYLEFWETPFTKARSLSTKANVKNIKTLR